MNFLKTLEQRGSAHGIDTIALSRVAISAVGVVRIAFAKTGLVLASTISSKLLMSPYPGQSRAAWRTRKTTTCSSAIS